MTTQTTLATFTVLFNPTVTEITVTLDYSRDSYKKYLEVTYEREETFATFEQAALAAFNFCGKDSVCCRVYENGGVEFFADADAREKALRERGTFPGAHHNYLACIVKNEPQVDGDFETNNPF